MIVVSALNRSLGHVSLHGAASAAVVSRGFYEYRKEDLDEYRRRRAADYADRAQLEEALKRAFGLLGDEAQAAAAQHVEPQRVDSAFRPLVQRVRYDDLARDLEAAQRVLDLYARHLQEEEETVAFLMMALH